MTNEKCGKQFSDEELRNEKWYRHYFLSNYMSSNLGRIKSLSRKTKSSVQKCGYRVIKERILNQILTKGGRYQVSLCKEGKIYIYFSHRFVLECIKGKSPKGMECCHNDGNPLNNRIENLRWDTHFNNEKDKVKHGTIAKGEKFKTSKMKKEDIINLRRLWLTGKILKCELAKMFKISRTHTSNILNNKRWCWLEQDNGIC